MKKTAIAGLGIGAIAIAFAAKDPIIMTVNGVDVPRSEFEYLYNKNSQQQINPQTLDEYVEMFKLYKLKVADARAEGIDTMASFLKETEQYRHDLAAPYLTDSVFINKLAEEAYQRSHEEVEARHIMLFKTRDAVENDRLRQRADSLLGVLKAGGDFEELARKYSGDRGSNSKGGYMGWIKANTFPITFEQAAYTLPEGEISEVVESPMGYHILKGGKHRKSRGKIRAAHILKLTQGKDEAAQAQAKHDIDSLYQVVKANPAIFGNVALANSEDPGSARQRGMLPPFGAGDMVAEFDSVAFALGEGEISTPFKTAYGYHIIHKIGNEPNPTFEQMKPSLVARITNPQDARYKLVRQNQTDKFAAKHKASLNKKTMDAMLAAATTSGIDSAFVVSWTSAPNGSMVLYTIDGKATKAENLVSQLKKVRIPASKTAAEYLSDRIAAVYNRDLVTAEENSLIESTPEYRNLLKEYVDGSLLYEVSVRKVWDKAAKDTDGLKKYFEDNRSNYRWTEPHAKGYLVQCTNDSVAALIREKAATLGGDTIANTLRQEFRGQASIDKVLVGKGTNAMVDNLLFGGPEVKSSNSRYSVYFMLNPRIVNEPEDVSDVKGLVTSDYQNEFQQAWEDELRHKYPVKVNEKVLKSVKRK